jgi:hypothetical protein
MLAHQVDSKASNQDSSGLSNSDHFRVAFRVNEKMYPSLDQDEAGVIQSWSVLSRPRKAGRSERQQALGAAFKSGIGHQTGMSPRDLIVGDALLDPRQESRCDALHQLQDSWPELVEDADSRIAADR